MSDLVLEGKFKIMKRKNGNIQFKINKLYDLNNFNNIYGSNPDSKVTVNDSFLILKIKKIFTKKNKTIIRFLPNNFNFPKKLKNGRIVISRIMKIAPPVVTVKPPPPSNITAPPVKSCGCGRSIAINTNVESGYSATSFPSTYSASYNLGPYPGRSQTTPMVGWAYLPPGGGA